MKIYILSLRFIIQVIPSSFLKFHFLCLIQNYYQGAKILKRYYYFLNLLVCIPSLFSHLIFRTGFTFQFLARYYHLVIKSEKIVNLLSDQFNRNVYKI